MSYIYFNKREWKTKRKKIWQNLLKDKFVNVSMFNQWRHYAEEKLGERNVSVNHHLPLNKLSLTFSLFLLLKGILKSCSPVSYDSLRCWMRSQVYLSKLNSMPSWIFDLTMVTWLSRSARDCSCQKPTACISSWQAIP